MTSTHDHQSDAAPVTERMHHNSWSANLETSVYADDPDRAVRDSINAIEHTAPGYHVNLATHPDLGHPETFLFGVLEEEYEDIEWEYVAQCGCGGHVTRVHVE